MQLAYVQFEPRLGDLDANRTSLARLLPAAAGADLVVLPELATSGYHFADSSDAEATSEPADGETTAMLTRLCRRHDFCVVCGLNERDGSARFNSAVVVGPEGLMGVYRKNHLFAREALFFEPGDGGFPVYEIGGARVGVLICYDYSFPECWTTLFRQGVDVVAHPSNFVLAGRAQRVVPVMAMLHRFFVVTANRIGTERDLCFTGASLVVDTRGNALVSANGWSEHVGLAEANLAEARDKQLTEYNHLLFDRRPDLYGALTEPTGGAEGPAPVAREDPLPPAKDQETAGST